MDTEKEQTKIMACTIQLLKLGEVIMHNQEDSLNSMTCDCFTEVIFEDRELNKMKQWTITIWEKSKVKIQDMHRFEMIKNKKMKKHMWSVIAWGMVQDKFRYERGREHILSASIRRKFIWFIFIKIILLIKIDMHFILWVIM